jgi:hypothetical protein
MYRDPNGKEIILSIVDVRNEQGKIIRREVTATIVGSIVDLTGNSRSESELKKPFSKVSKTFGLPNGMYSVVYDKETESFTDEKIPITLSIRTDIDVVRSVRSIGANDHVLLIVDELKNLEKGEDLLGLAKNLGRISAVEEESLSSGNYIETVLHELGHNLLGEAFTLLDGSSSEHTPDGKGLMGASGNGDINLSLITRINLWKNLGAIGKEGTYYIPGDGNAKSDTKEFIDDNLEKKE